MMKKIYHDEEKNYKEIIFFDLLKSIRNIDLFRVIPLFFISCFTLFLFIIG